MRWGSPQVVAVVAYVGALISLLMWLWGIVSNVSPYATSAAAFVVGLAGMLSVSAADRAYRDGVEEGVTQVRGGSLRVFCNRCRAVYRIEPAVAEQTYHRCPNCTTVVSLKRAEVDYVADPL